MDARISTSRTDGAQPGARHAAQGEPVELSGGLIWEADGDTIGVRSTRGGGAAPVRLWRRWEGGMMEVKRSATGEGGGGHGGAGAPERAPVQARWFEPGRVSIRDFLTDGSLARLCDEVSRLTGVPIWLRDTDGLVIVPGEGGGGGPMWRSVDAEHGARRAFALVARAFTGMPDLFVSPLRTSVGEIGALVMPADWGSDDPVERRALERAVTLLGRTALEACEGQILLQRRLNELDAMFRLSSSLTSTEDSDRVLLQALDVAIEVLRLDAGSISVFEEPGAGSAPTETLGQTGAVLRHRAVRGLSDEWLRQVTPLSIDGVLRASALAGEVVCVDDLKSDPRIADHARAQREGLASLIVTGLVFQGRANGLIRLYSRAPRAFSHEERELLRSIADHVASVLATARLRELRQQDREMQRQLKTAADVQKRMLPRSIPTVPGFDVAARYAPTYQIGGDFYDLLESGGRLGLVVGDVSGKGVPAALIMASVRATARALAGVQSERGLPLGGMVSAINRAIHRDTQDNEFVTLWCAMADPATLRASIVSAGHDPALLFRRGAGGGGGVAVHELGSGGMILGIDPDQTFDEATFQLQAGDVLLAFTDGLTDAADFDDQKFGKARVINTMRALLESEPGAAAARIVEHLMWSLRQFRGVRTPTDDVTIVAVRVG